jgi:hypothetical protein
MGNHLHLVVEAKDAETLYSGARSLGIRLARGLNAMMGGAGSVFVDRYHLRPLKTPTEVKNAIAYVLGNHRRHSARWGERAAEADGYTSAAAFDGWKRPPPDRPLLAGAAASSVHRVPCVRFRSARRWRQRRALRRCRGPPP